MNDWLQVALLPRGLSFPSTQSNHQSGSANNLTEKLVHSSWTLNRWGQLLNGFLWFHQNSFLKNACHPCLCAPSSFLVFPFVPLTQTVASGMLCGLTGCWFSILWDVFSQTLELLTCFFRLLLPWPPRPAPSLLKKTQGNWQAAGQGKLSYIISPSGAFLCCLYLKAIIFYISWQEFSSTSDP